MRVFLIQHGLVDKHSHYYGETLKYVEAIREMGAEPVVYAHVSCEPGIVAELGARPAFPLKTDLMVDQDPLTAELSRFIVCANAFAQALTRNLPPPANFAQDDLVLVPYGTQNEAYGLGIWLRSLPLEKRPYVALVCHRPEFTWKIDGKREQVKGNASFWRFAGRLLSQTSRARVALFAPDARLVRFLGTASGLAWRVCGMPTPWFAPLPAALSAAGDIDVGMMGEYRPERGSRIVPETLALIDRQRPGLRYFVHVGNPGDRAGLESELATLGFSGTLEIATGNLSSEEFVHNLLRIRLVVLPYMAQYYAMRSSGVLSECAGYGIPAVVPQGTWLSDRLDEKKAAGTMFREWTARSVAAATVDALDKLPALADEAARLCGPWREENSARRVLQSALQALHVPL